MIDISEITGNPQGGRDAGDTGWKQTKDALRYRQDLAYLVAHISSRFVNLSPNEINDAIRRSLGEMGIFMDADRSYLLFARKDAGKIDITHEWCAPDVESDMPLFQDLDMEDFAAFAEPLLRSEVVYIPRVSEVFKNNNLGKAGEAISKINSILLVPIEFGQSIVGCLGFDVVREEKSWPPDVTALLRVAGGVFAGALERKRAEEAYQESAQFIRQVVDNAPFGAHFYMLGDDDSLILTGANKAADQILKIDHQSLLGRPIVEAFPGLANTSIPDIYKAAAREGRVHTHEQIDYDGDGIKGVFEISAFQTVPGRMAVFFSDVTRRRQIEKTLVEEATRRRILFEQSPDGIVIVHPQTMRFLDFNAAAYRQLGYSREEFAEMSLHDVEAVQVATKKITGDATEGGQFDCETLHKTSSGALRNIHVTAQKIDVLGRPVYLCIWRDITEHRIAEEERKKLQAQLAQAQKMESVGRLAGGVAHDFNNMLSVIIGHAELALGQFAANHPVHADLEEIRKAAQRSADLTRQLLAFARKQAVAPRILNLNQAISGMLKMLRRLIGEDIDLVWKPSNDLCTVKMDPAQLDQILANLCVNSRDAISGVGSISIETRNTVLSDNGQADGAGIAAGQYVELILSDSGCGMSKEVLDHLFEPFFTTKEVGQGTGLGLATVYGIVRQNEGFINVETAPGKGTAFHIFLPVRTEQAEETTAVPEPKGWRSKGETVLLVEDEQAILTMVEMFLQRMGFWVLKADSPGKAVRLASEKSGSIDLLITDVIMPEMNGRDLAEKVALLNPGLKCLFMSGYTADVIARSGVLEDGVHFIQKPFSASDLAAKVREAIEPEA